MLIQAKRKGDISVSTFFPLRRKDVVRFCHSVDSFPSGVFLPKVSFPTKVKLLTMDQLLSVSKTTAVISVILRDYTL